MSEDTATLMERLRMLPTEKPVLRDQIADALTAALEQERRKYEAALTGMGDAQAALERAERENDELRDAAVGNYRMYEAVEARAQKAEAALRLIADRTYPATYIGKRDDGVEMYGGSDDASKFARAVLDEQATGVLERDDGGSLPRSGEPTESSARVAVPRSETSGVDEQGQA